MSKDIAFPAAKAQAQNKHLRGIYWSGLAAKHSEPWHRPRRRRDALGGLCVHTCGRPWILRQDTTDPHVLLDRLCDYYRDKTATHYVVSQRADIVQIASDLEVAWGAAMSNPKTQDGQIERERRWADWIQEKGHSETWKRWRQRWLGFDRPSDLVRWHGAGASANRVLIHIEVMPQTTRSGIYFTPAQHDAVAALAADLAVRHGWAEEPEWWRSPRLVGHEDLSSTRWHPRLGGWDPGALAASPRWDWARVYETLRAAS